MENKNPRGTPLYGRMRGSVRNLKAVEKIIHNRKKFYQNRKTHAKPIKKPYSIRYSVDKGNIQRFHGYSRSDEAHNGRLDERETGIQIGKSKNHIRDQIRSPLDKYFLTKTENHMFKDGKSANRNEHPIPKTDLKKKSRKSQCPL